VCVCVCVCVCVFVFVCVCVILVVGQVGDCGDDAALHSVEVCVS